MKTCTKCGEEKPDTKFPLRHDRPGKRRSVCASCAYIRSQQYPSKTGVPKEPVFRTPLPAMDLNEQLACLRFRKWRYPVTDNRPLRATIGGGYV